YHRATVDEACATWPGPRCASVRLRTRARSCRRPARGQRAQELHLGGEPFRVPGRRPELAAQGEEDLDHDWVELRADAVAEPAAGFLDRQALAVGPIRRHRVERIADEDDPRLQRNLPAGDSVRIAPSVEVLVAASDDRAHFREPLDRRQNLLAELGMLLHDPPLL